MLEILFSFCCLASSFSHGAAQNFGDDRIDLSHFGARIYGEPIINSGRTFNESEGNPEEQGPYVEGDLLIPTSSKNGMKAESTRWNKGEIPFEIRGAYTAHNMDMIERAFIQYHKNTCIRFIPRRPKDKDYISIENGSSGCWSSVGRTGGKQVVNLQSPGCLNKIGTVIHELLHAVGFLHEQNREERDGFVVIKKNNIRQGYEINFNKAKSGETSGFGVGYDYGSVMHYSSLAFSKNNQPTIEAKSKSTEKMGQREGFSKKDIDKVNKMYKCQRASGTSDESNSTTVKPAGDSFFGNLFETFFPNSSMDEEEMVMTKKKFSA